MRLTILETSDIHGYVYPTNYANDEELAIGAAKVASKMKELSEKATGPVLKIENGDFIQGSPFSYFVAKEKNLTAADLTQVTDLIGYDVHVLGNHEFNYGRAYLEETINSYQKPVLAANILNEQGEPAFGKAYEIIEREGIKIAILGLDTQYIPHWEQPATIKGLTFASAVATAKKYVPQLRELADVVIVSYHGGFERNLVTGEPTELLTGENEGYQLLQEVAGIDALLTGHQHRELAAIVHGVPVVQPGYQGSHVAEIQLELEKTEAGVKIIEQSAALHPVTDVTADAEILAAIAPIEKNLEQWLDQPVGKVSGDMTITDAMAARLTEHPYVEFINRVQLAATGADISGTALFNNEGKGFGEVITMRDIITNYIYPNTLAVLKISGADLKAALEQTANYLILDEGVITFNPAFIDPKPQYYNYDMFEGVDYVIDMTRPAGQRITTLLFNGQPVDMTDEFELVTNQYRAVGGGNYQMFTPEKIIREVQIDMTELIANYLHAHPLIEASVNHNFKIIK